MNANPGKQPRHCGMVESHGAQQFTGVDTCRAPGTNPWSCKDHQCCIEKSHSEHWKASEMDNWSFRDNSNKEDQQGVSETRQRHGKELESRPKYLQSNNEDISMKERQKPHSSEQIVRTVPGSSEKYSTYTTGGGQPQAFIHYCSMKVFEATTRSSTRIIVNGIAFSAKQIRLTVGMWYSTDTKVNINVVKSGKDLKGNRC